MLMTLKLFVLNLCNYHVLSLPVFSKTRIAIHKYLKLISLPF